MQKVKIKSIEMQSFNSFLLNKIYLMYTIYNRCGLIKGRGI